MRLIDADALMDFIKGYRLGKIPKGELEWKIEKAPTIEATPVVHGRWERCGGDSHSSGYAIFCSVCNKVHFVNYKNSLGGLNCKELFEKPKCCSSCGAVMDGEE